MNLLSKFKLIEALTRLIVKITPTKKDDKILEAIDETVEEVLGLNVEKEEKEKPKP